MDHSVYPSAEMSVNHTLLDFRVTPDPSGNWMVSVSEKMGRIIEESFKIEKPEFSSPTTMLFAGQKGIQCTVQLFPDGLVTLDVVQYINNISSEQILKRSDYIDLRDKVDEALSCSKAHFIPTIHRGREILRYHDTSDGRMKEYDFDKEVFKQKSDYQDVWIAHSSRYGNMLFLDLEEMLAESDIDYTKALLGNGRESYKDKDVLILGGGDGGVLNELLKESPKFVTMIRIDDCVKAMKEYVKSGKTFDYVINDLTDIPVSVSLHHSHWDFVREILNLTLQVLKPEGKFFAQGTNGATCKKQIEQYEQQLMNLCYPVEFRREFAFVPSFEESWTFYEVWRKRT
ncbi:hypothetical protein pdam_00011451 [Pocillopora damicornis]|uniref:PABS domain-containing protein n=1 Tax=Pocillopora damicornis TaxID=46731 RepID=A0A3M6URW0_POCDA|nr:hypothetical protein pdam_00011451 [Pocillopora damicornis]